MAELLRFLKGGGKNALGIRSCCGLIPQIEALSSAGLHPPGYMYRLV